MNRVLLGVFIALGIIGTLFLIAGLWEFLVVRETREFDRGIARIEHRMTREEVIEILGRPSATVSGAAELARRPKGANEWYSDFERPIEPSDSALTFTANEREAYIYLDDENRVAAVLLAKKGGEKGFTQLDGKAD